MKILWVTSIDVPDEVSSAEIGLARGLKERGFYINALIIGCKEANNAYFADKPWDKFLSYEACGSAEYDNEKVIPEMAGYIKALLSLEKHDALFCSSEFAGYFIGLDSFAHKVVMLRHNSNELFFKSNICSAFDPAFSISFVEPKIRSELGFPVITVVDEETRLAALEYLDFKNYSRRKKRVLIVTDVRFWQPGLGSHSRIFSLCQSLQDRFHVTIFFYGTVTHADLTNLKSGNVKAEVVSYKEYEKEGKAVSENSTTPDVIGLRKKRFPIFYQTLSVFLKKSSRFDVVIWEYLWLAYTADALTYRALRILDTHDLMSYRNFRFSSRALPVNISITFAEELNILNRFDVAIAIQNEEAKVLSANLDKAISICCPHGVPSFTIGDIKLDKSDDRVFEIGFVGGNSEANYAAINWFIYNVWSSLKYLPVRLNVYGSVCERLQSSVKGLILHGLVPNLEVAYRQCDIMINPMIHGGGIKIKSVEALAYGKPLISSPEGAVGIQDPEKSGIIVAKNRSEYISAIQRLAASPNEIELMSQDAHRAALEQFSECKAFDPLIKLIELY